MTTDQTPTSGSDVTWFKSSYSAAQNECVEAAHLTHVVGLRDSTRPEGPVLTFQHASFAAFLNQVKHNA